MGHSACQLAPIEARVMSPPRPSPGQSRGQRCPWARPSHRGCARAGPGCTPRCRAALRSAPAIGQEASSARIRAVVSCPLATSPFSFVQSLGGSLHLPASERKRSDPTATHARLLYCLLPPAVLCDNGGATNALDVPISTNLAVIILS